MVKTRGELLTELAARPMNPLQRRAVVICLAINLIDGFDVLAISFAASAISAQWQLSPAALGLLFSSGLAGMTLASIFLSFIADRIGRRPTILLGLVIISGGMALSALAQSAEALATWRFTTGLGVGLLLPSLNTLVAEFSSARRRELAITVMQAGYPLGAVLGGFAALAIIDQFGWRTLFWFGAGLSGLLIPIVYWRLPESIAFLLSRAQPQRLTPLNDLLVRLDLDPLAALPTDPPEGLNATLTQSGNRRAIGLLSLAFFLVMGSFYFVASWTPKLLIDAGLDSSAGISGGILLNITGVIGGLVLGGLAHRVSVHRLTALYLAISVVALTLFSQLSGLWPMILGAALIGYFLIGAMMGLYSLTPGLFAAPVRAGATGIAVGLGRLGAVAGPALTGWLLASGWPPGNIYLLFALPLAVAVWLVLTMRQKFN